MHEEKIEHVKGVIRSCKSKRDESKRTTTKKQLLVHKTLHKQLKIEQYEPQEKRVELMYSIEVRKV